MVSDHRIIRVPVLLVLHCVAFTETVKSTYYIPIWSRESSYDLGQKQDALQFASPPKAYSLPEDWRRQNKQLCYANCVLNPVTRVASDSDIEPCIEKHNPSVIHKERSKLLLIKSVTHAK